MKNLVNQIDKAIELLRNGEIVALPTETVYGLAADCTNDLAVAKIFALKKRPSFNPLIVHVYDFAAAEKIGVFSDAAWKMALLYWPGPLTIVVPKKDKNFALLASGRLDTIAIRMPSHPLMQEVLKSGLMLAAPSANISGKLTSTSAEHARNYFPDVHLIDGGKCEVGLESTVITFDENDRTVLLRAGFIQIPYAKIVDDKKIISPGQLLKHYAPNSPIRIDVDAPFADEIFIGFGKMECDFNLSVNADLVEAAANLFSVLHQADSLNKKIAVAKIPNHGIGIAINDRLQKAAS